jgi:2-polyprenyl-6-methoxyphenol hydroxylase-like FAD-dependent oxidoreductase
MRQRNRCEVLVVGAGPVGMFTALLLARNGIDVRVIDQASGVAAQSYACGLHPATLSLMEAIGLDTQVLPWGRRISSIGFYRGQERKGEVDLSNLAAPYPFVLVLPQTSLERLLECKLTCDAGAPVSWNHRLSGVRSENGNIVATVDELAGTALGYDAPHWETMVSNTSEWRANFIIGADGFHSLVRRCANIDCDLIGKPRLFVVYEFGCEVPDNELRIVLNETDINVMWPLPDRRCRWSFQWTETEESSDFPFKERSELWFEEPSVAEKTKQHLQQLLGKRAPWFDSAVERIEWATDVQFEYRVAKRFGEGRAWLAGDAAHQTGPIGMQSMNLGLREGEMLARLLKKVLRDGASLNAMAEYERTFRREWEHLLGVDATIQPRGFGISPLVRDAKVLLSCLPGSTQDLQPMLDQLGFDLTVAA